MPRKCPCGNIPMFNIPGETSRIYCKFCKVDGMIDVGHKKCRCGTIPTFNVPNEKKAICCVKCKLEGMIDVKSKRCLCGKSQPVYNMPVESKAICCVKCKSDYMIDVVNRRCQCGKSQPVYNVSTESKGVGCIKCKSEDMIDVKNKKCKCGKSQPSYNVPGKIAGMCCLKCKTPDMIDVANKVCPGYDGEKCPVRTYISRGHEYCLSCDPNEDRGKRYKRYENEFFDYMKDKLDVYKREFHVSFDSNYTAKKFARLDGIVFGDGIIVCLEVDENGHLGYECDNHRMHLVTGELLQKYPHHSVSWVRVNPTIGAKNEWSETSMKKREKRFEDVVNSVKDILITRDTRVVYIGFD